MSRGSVLCIYDMSHVIIATPYILFGGVPSFSTDYGNYIEFNGDLTQPVVEFIVPTIFAATIRLSGSQGANLNFMSNVTWDAQARIYGSDTQAKSVITLSSNAHFVMMNPFLLPNASKAEISDVQLLISADATIAFQIRLSQLKLRFATSSSTSQVIGFDKVDWFLNNVTVEISNQVRHTVTPSHEIISWLYSGWSFHE
jgi:hypothetical protein